MAEEARLGAAVAVSLLAVLLLTPVAIRVAVRTGFEDRPTGYKAHARPTPYLGGAAVIGALLVAVLALAEEASRLTPLLAGALVLWVVGTIDDRRTVSPFVRVAVEAIAAGLLWATGLGWALFDSAPLDLLFTVAWIVGLVNAFNLMDNMDGAAGTVAAASAAGIAALALMLGDATIAVLALALCGACIGFLRFNLSAPAARIFLGDGGSMPIGFLAGAAIMALPLEQRLGWSAPLLGAMLGGLPLLDTTLVSVARRRRGVPLWLGARDHLTHRMRAGLPSARAVAAALLVTQAGLSALALVSLELGRNSVIGAAVVCGLAGAAVIFGLEVSPWRPLRQQSSA